MAAWSGSRPLASKAGPSSSHYPTSVRPTRVTRLLIRDEQGNAIGRSRTARPARLREHVCRQGARARSSIRSSKCLWAGFAPWALRHDRVRRGGATHRTGRSADVMSLLFRQLGGNAPPVMSLRRPIRPKTSDSDSELSYRVKSGALGDSAQARERIAGILCSACSRVINGDAPRRPALGRIVCSSFLLKFRVAQIRLNETAFNFWEF